ncbi:MAG: tyramine oxidase subunit B [Ruminococcus sp.]|uniref:tyramine oxidase subunit B n=1 Tax=Clostridia TaxID=186801 RepID=UPI00189852B6|nr:MULTISPECIES: tyramine oxidase subunit B [Clostridia]MBS6625653.1 ornithine cyclodeaminase [Ruminococcus sp.]MCB6331237.1 ornithine cyclodeaminase [Blautia faecis]MCB6580102.1 ornithine cyclodeaminase [Blautia faecis]MCB6627288.1 ornithine cyclodeaminase [Blautia sp. 210702-DFI.1.159]MCB7292234.1 ornithine cyclodeaminase [Blautia faecis]
MDAKIDFLYLSEPDMIKAGVKDMKSCVDVMEDLLITLYKGDYVMGGANHNSHGCMIMFPDDPQFPGMPKNADDRRFMAMPAYLGGSYQMAGMKWYGSNVENKKVGLPRSILMMMLNDKDTGAPLALMSANLVSAYRTGGIPGVGAKYLARKDSRVVSIIGPGVMGKTSLAAFVSVCPNLDTVKIKGRSQRSLDAFTRFIREELPQIKNIEICDSVEEAVKDSDIISFTTTVRDDVSSFPYINGDWIKKGALVSMPSAARFDDDFLAGCKLVVDNSKLYEAWEEEYPYPTYPQVQIIGTKFTDLKHDGKIEAEDIIDITDIIEKRHPGRTSDDEIIVYSVGGMPVEDIAWGGTVYRNAVKLGIGIKLPLWDKPEMA